VTIGILSGQHLPKPKKGKNDFVNVGVSVGVSIHGLPMDEISYTTDYTEGKFDFFLFHSA